jgi:hypothetical protein
MPSCFRGDEDVEDVFFLDDGANVAVAVSDRSCCLRSAPCCICWSLHVHSLAVVQFCDIGCRGGAIFTDFRSSSDAVRAPSIGKRIDARSALS